eukprot:1116001-Amphidinium_carterae.1
MVRISEETLLDLVYILGVLGGTGGRVSKRSHLIWIAQRSLCRCCVAAKEVVVASLHSRRPRYLATVHQTNKPNSLLNSGRSWTGAASKAL